VASRQFTLRRLLIATALVAACLALLRQQPSALIVFTIAYGLYVLSLLTLASSDRLLGDQRAVPSSMGVPLAIAGIVLLWTSFFVCFLAVALIIVGPPGSTR
jgi:hypothetical protein